MNKESILKQLDKVESFVKVINTSTMNSYIEVQSEKALTSIVELRQEIEKESSADSLIFDVAYDMQEFRKEQKELFDEKGKRYTGCLLSHRQAEGMLRLINKLEANALYFASKYKHGEGADSLLPGLSEQAKKGIEISFVGDRFSSIEKEMPKGLYKDEDL